MLRGLVVNEIIKIYIRPRAWIMIGILALCGTLLSMISANTIKTPPSDWKGVLQTQINEQKQLLSSPSTPTEEKGKLQENIAISTYRINHNLPPSGSMVDKKLEMNIKHSKTQSFYESHTILLYVVAILAGIVATESISTEFSDKTIKLLLIRPANRVIILLAKYLASLTFAVGCFFVAFLYTLMAATLILGPSEAAGDQLSYQSGHVVTIPGFSYLFLSMGHYLVLVLMMTTLAFSLATFFRSGGMTISVVTLATIGGKPLASYIRTTPWKGLADYLLFTYTDPMEYEKGPSDWALAVVSTYYIILIASTCRYFKRRDVL
ncbi:ABC transporter permease [Pasteuria penetrans]|uniref:ABC transporter permease n=1 Tax=Pasteuria penetrans TaxID=86005 RepID=UPI000FB7A4B3|nr:ABC transporter permease subunit [Pasteuria penetrans]